ncbi:hypothetical protein C8R44DRAFT_135092 [Mycena epipterygia]|nr:hypothetical protein C8R44DRAFT_135092 [Mycena epipterygia]
MSMRSPPFLTQRISETGFQCAARSCSCQPEAEDLRRAHPNHIWKLLKLGVPSIPQLGLLDKDQVTLPQPITLHFQNVARVAGETIEGHVDLNVILAQEDRIEQLRIKLRGSIVAKITTSSGNTNNVHKQTVLLVHSNLSLWKQGGAFPEAGSHILACPFRFQLPENLPPSFHCSGNSLSGAVSYSLEVVGDRPGLFRSDRCIRRLISVVPPASQSRLLVRESLMQGWSGSWKHIKREEKLRQGIWGDYSHACATLSIPNLRSFPITTPIPFNLEVETQTKLVHRSDRPEEKGKQLFPAPPLRSSEVKQVLRRTTEIRARGLTRHAEDTFDLQHIRRLDAIERVSRARAVLAVAEEPEWIPKEGKEDRGIWKRKVHFNFTLTFPFAPTFSTETLDWMYVVQFVVPFPGIGNDLKLQFPIHLGPGSACPPPPPPIGVPGSSGLTYADIVPSGPPPMQDLPPAYWAGNDHDWDDEKN